MAAVDRRLGVVRRGATPAAPKPINLPSQKLENHRLVPEVEIVPRGTCCWGNAGRSTLASCSNNEGIDSPSSPLGTDGTADYDSKEQSGSMLADDVQSPVEKADLSLFVESSTSPISSTTCVMSAETVMACPHLGFGLSISKAGSDSPAASDTGSFSESVARPSSSGSGSSSATPPVAVQDQKQKEERSESFEACSGDHEKISISHAKQETHSFSESQRGSQDFGYFEGFYSTQAPFPRPGMPYPSGAGMGFGSGLHPEPPQHYSFLGVPYYDSVKDKEIVVITMVGNPGYYGSYLPHPGFSDQYSRPMYGNFPLQFGHFEHYVGPQVSPEMKPICSSEDFGFVSYEQDNYKQSYATDRPAGIMWSNNSVCFPTSLSTREHKSMLEDCGIPKRMGRQKTVTRNKKAALREASNAGSVPERRVTLLTKVSQHEVIISDMQRKSKHGGARLARSTFAPHFSAQDVTEVPPALQPAQNSSGIPVGASQAEDVILAVEVSSALTVQVQSGASQSMPDEVLLESTDATAVVEVVEVKKSCALDDRVSNNEDSSSLLRCTKDAKAVVSESSLTSVSTPSSVSAASSAPVSPSEAQDVSVDNTSEVRCVSKYGESHLGSPGNDLAESADSMEPASECLNDSETLSASTAATLPNEHTQESMQGLHAKKRNRKWRRKGSVDVTELESEEFNWKVKDSVVDKVAIFLESSSDGPKDGSSTPGAESWPSSSGEVKSVSEGSISSFPCALATQTTCDKSAASSKNGHSMVPVVNMAPDRAFMNSKIGAKAGSSNGDVECTPQLCPNQALDSFRKSAPAAGGHNSQPRSVIPGAGKRWRPKLSGEVGRKISTTKMKTGWVVMTSNERSCQVPDNSLANNCTSREVLCDGHPIEDHKNQLQVGVDSCKGIEDERVPKVSCDQTSKKPTQQLSHSDDSSEDVQGDRNNKLLHLQEHQVSCDRTSKKPSQHLSHSDDSREDVQGGGNKQLLHTVQEQQSSEDLSLTNAIRTTAVSLTESEENMTGGIVSSRNVISGKHGHAWKVVGKQVLQPKMSVVRKLEESEHRNSVVKNKESVYFVQGASRASWKPKQSTAVCTSIDGSMGRVNDNPSNFVLKNKGSVEWKEEGVRRPFSMKSNFLNDDNKKAAQLEQSLSYSSINMEHGKVIENLHAVGIGLGKSSTCIKLVRRGEFHIAKKTDRKGWVVKSETACSTA